MIEKSEIASRQDIAVEWALYYASVGWYVFPLHSADVWGGCSCGNAECGRNTGRHPRTKRGYYDATTDPDQIRAWWTRWPDANIGVDLGRSGLLSVAPDSTEWLAEFERRGLPPTWMFESGSGEGHQHHIYQRPEGAPVDRECRTQEYDILSDGYAILPPSQTTGPYRWLDEPNGTGPVEAPAWAVEMLRKTRSPREVPELDPNEPVIEVTADMLSGEAWFHFTGQRPFYKLDGRVGRSESLVKIAGALAPYFNAATIAQALEERDAALGWNKYTDRNDPTEYIKLALRVVRERRELDQLQARLKRIQDGPSPADTDKPRFVFLTEEELHTRPDPTWRITEILPTDSYAQILAASGHYKTFLALSMAKHIAAGEPWVGFKTEQARVAYIAGEGASGLKLRIEALNIHHGWGVSPYFHLLPEAVQMYESDDIDWLLFALDALPDMPQVVFLDTQARMTVGANENSAQDMGKFNRNVDRIRACTGGSVASLNHLNRDGDYRGSSSVPGALDTWIRLDGAAGASVRVDCIKQKDADEFLSFTLMRRVIPLGREVNGKELTSLVFVSTEEAQVMNAKTGKISLAIPLKGDPSENAMLRALRDSTEAEPFTRKEVQDRVRLGKSRVNTLLKTLIGQGYIGRIGESTATRYWLSERGQRRLNGEGG